MSEEHDGPWTIRERLAAMDAQAVEVCEVFASFGWVCGGATIVSAVRTVCELAKSQKAERDRLATEVAALEQMCRDAIKYAREDEMRTPGVTRLQRLLDRMAAVVYPRPAAPEGGPTP